MTVNATIDAVATSSEITATYRRYLQSLLAVRDPKIDSALRQAIDTSPILEKGPYLEATPPYVAGASIGDLISEGVLAPGFAKLESDALPLLRPLYVHQEQAIRKIIAGRNVVVATGTGSGKTESFLLPILDSLVREHELGDLGPGVRALLLYPMNALANDQLKRLREVLAGFPQITFGRYTGDTEEDPQRAREAFGELNIGEPMLSNELLSRREMRRTPPNILLTNFAMLEYLLLRPLDMELFATSEDSRWRFIVADEAHVYDGSQGAEIAMLLRRVRDRVAPASNIQCIATSATVGTDPNSVTRFATNLFGQPFEWVDDDATRRDLITARRVQISSGPSRTSLSAEDYVDHLQSGHDLGADFLSQDRAVMALRGVLADGPKPFDEVAAAVFGDDPQAGSALAALVSMASASRSSDGTAPLSARYHLFLRATEGAFTCLSSAGPHVQLARHETCPQCDSPVFEIGSCKRCGAVHVIGQPTHESGVLMLRPRKAASKGTWLVLDTHDAQTDEDEVAVADDGVDVSAEDAKLCTACGALINSAASSCPGCRSSELRSVRRLAQRGDEVAGCLVCGARGSGTVRVFETGADATGAVITTSLYQNIPPSSEVESSQRPGEGRKLLAFSDSRQAAAYFAPYLEDSYARLQRRRLITEGLRLAHADEEPVAIDDVVFKTRAAAARLKHFAGGMTAQQQARVVAPWVMAEALATDDRQSLEGLGLVGMSLYRNPGWRPPEPLLRLGLTADEVWAFIQELVRTLRHQGAVTMPEDVPPNHEIFAPRLGPIRVRQTGSEAIRKVLSWLPTRGTNRRVDYTERVLDTLKVSADPREILAGVWKYLTAPQTPIDWLESSTERGLGVVYQVAQDRLRLSLATDLQPVFRCRTCRRMSPFSIRGVCPALGCEGSLEQFSPPPVEVDHDHYRVIYRSMNAVPLRALEHTAQWTNTRAAEIQHQFVRGEVNALSCSTTFELGVDVGELQAVMLRNMPPSTANYVQRAGRAGRRSGAAALVVTYAQRRSHDLTRFAAPEVMISGSVRAPYVPLENPRIDQRHAHSVALSAFFRWLFETTGRIDRTAGEFFLSEDDRTATVSLVRTWLTPVPKPVEEALHRILPRRVATEIGVDSGTWAEKLITLLETVQVEMTAEVSALEALRDQAATEHKFGLAQRYLQVGNTVRRRELLGFLGNRNVLPKYGFPVDSVELRTHFSYGRDVGANLDLTRDLSQAIYEYAPDATLVAGGRCWTSRGIYRLPGRDLVEYTYFVCRRCGGFSYGLGSVDSTCEHCGEVSQSAPRTLTIPEYGFVAERESRDPGPRPPRRSWSGAVHVLGEPPEAETRKLRLEGGTIEAKLGARGRLIALADGPSGMGFWICDWCGYGSARVHHPQRPPRHNHLLKNQPCGGPQRWLDLAHSYETDLLTLDMRIPGFQWTQAAWKSVLYAVLEAACEVLEIARDDVGGSLTPRGADTWLIALFDAVSGGAGHVLQIGANLERVLHAALHRVSSCECGPETSCYGCLRSYANQLDHDDLSRGAAEQVLRRLIVNRGTIDPSLVQAAEQVQVPPEVPADWADIYSSASAAEADAIVALAEAGVVKPELGAESAGGIPVPLSWPDRLTALDFGLEEGEKSDLKAEGWNIVRLKDVSKLTNL